MIDINDIWDDDRDMDAHPLIFHASRDPLICPGHEYHDFAGWREFEDGNGGESVCMNCGVGAMAYSLALDF